MIHKNVVQDIAFVFHINDLEYNLPNCAGMSRVFYTRYSYDESNRLIDVDCRNHFPFSTAVLEPYPSRIWYAILEVKHNVEKMLNDPKQYQPCRKMLLVHFSLEAWSYLFVNLVNSGAIVAQYVRNNTEKFMHCDLGLSSRRIKKHLTLVRVDCLNSLVGARKIFGLTFGIGVRNRAPNKGEPTVFLHHSDVVNLVDVNSNNNENQLYRAKEFIASQGVDFIYESVSRLLKIRIRYTKFDAHKPIVAATLNLNREITNLQQPVHERNNWVSHVAPGTYFATHEGQMACVVRVEGDNVYVTLDDDGNEVVYNLNEAALLLQSYIG